MARFPDIPAEIILTIIAFVQLEDLENFAQSCQRLQSIASSALKKHRLLIRQYSTIKDVEAHTISKTLKQVLINPQTGRYIRNITLNHVRDPKWFSYNAGYGAEDLQLFVAASRKSIFLSPPGEAPLSYRSVIERGDEDILLAILLPLLPNLTSLILPRVNNGRHSCWTSDVLSYIPHASTPTLAKLSTVCINGGGEYPHLNDAVMYANLPSMKSLTALRVSACGYDYALVFGQGRNSLNSYITNLELWECKVPAKHLQQFLSGCHCLESFAYSCGRGGDPDRISACSIREALPNKAKTTLRKLTILGCIQTRWKMGTLRPFEVLEEVCTDWGSLASLAVNRAEPLLPIVESFPASLRKLSLNDEIGRHIEHHSKLVKSVVRAQERRTHVEDPAIGGLRLQELTITINPPVWMPEPITFHGTDEWYSECEKVGITLDHFLKKTEKVKILRSRRGGRRSR